MQAAPDAGPRGKKDPRDFALWKGHKEGEPETASWASRGAPAGRAGTWSARPWSPSTWAPSSISTAADWTCGSRTTRTKWPSPAAAGQGFANFWMHNGMVTFEGEKMSKSIGNIITPAANAQDARPLVVRYYLGQAHTARRWTTTPDRWRKPGAAVERIEGFMQRALKFLLGGGVGLMVTERVPEAFAAAMDDDLDVAAGAGRGARNECGPATPRWTARDKEAATRALHQVMAMTDVLHINPLDPHWHSGGADTAAHQALDTLVRAQLEERRAARAAKDWSRADAIRDTLAEAGIVVEDSAEGASWSLG